MIRKIFCLFGLLLLTSFSSATPMVVDKNFEVSYWITNDSKIRFEFVLKNHINGWMSLAFHEFLFPADSIIVWWNNTTNQAEVWDAYNPGIPTLEMFPAPTKDNDPIFISYGDKNPNNNQENVRIVSQSNKNGIIDIVCERPLITNDIFDIQFYTGRQYRVMAMYSRDGGLKNPSGDFQPNYYPSVARSVFTLQL